MTDLLQIENLNAFYGLKQVLQDVSFSVRDKTITTLLGSNGAGKSTTLRAISRMIFTTGKITWDGKRIDGWASWRPEDIARLGIAHVPEGRGTFIDLTVEENLRIGSYVRKDKTKILEDLEKVYTYFPVLKERKKQPAGTLSGGEQQMLAVARALMLKPRLILLDEPSLGIAPIVTQEIFRIIQRINKEEGVSVLLIEQNAAMALKISSYVYLLEVGQISLSGTPEELMKNDLIRQSYFGFNRG